MIARNRSRLGRRQHRHRRGATILEFSLACPILFLLTLGMVVLAQGVSQFQVVALLAREGARWASVRGAEYRATTGQPAASAVDVRTQAILPRAVGLDPQALTTTVAWSPDNTPGSQVTVTVSYRWTPAAYLGAMTLTSSSVMTVSY